jgi:hypothetical protein
MNVDILLFNCFKGGSKKVRSTLVGFILKLTRVKAEGIIV